MGWTVSSKNLYVETLTEIYMLYLRMWHQLEISPIEVIQYNGVNKVGTNPTWLVSLKRR